MRNLYTLPAMVALAFCCAVGFSQEIKRSFRTETFTALSEDTSIYNPQIDDKFVIRPERPENPWEATERKDPPNDLVAGQVRNVARGSVGPKFPAISATGWTPPDPDLAVGPNQIVAVVNSSVAFFNKDGTHTFQQTASNFFSGLGAGTFIFDPKCYYDRVHQRFVVIFPERQTNPQVSKILLAVSDDNNPSGVWHKYRIEARMTISGTNYWLDYPGLGYNKDAVVISGNMFSFGSGFAGVQYIIVPTTPLLSGGAATARYIFDDDAASVQISEVLDPNLDRVYAASRGGSSSLDIYAISALGSPNPILQATTVTVPSNLRPQMEAPSTGGNTLDALDGRLYNVVWRDGKLVAAHTIQSGSLLKVRWYQVNTNSWPNSGNVSLGMSGDVGGAAGVHHHMPAISINSAGDISTIFTRSSTSITADMMYAGRFASDPVGTMGLPVNLESSSGNDYSGGRWGDYFGVDVDPVDDIRFWGIAMGVAANNDWRTSIFEWTISSPGTTVAPAVLTMERGSVLSGVVGDLGVGDNVRVEMRPGATLSTGEDPVRARVEAVSPTLTPSAIRLSLESQSSAVAVRQKIEAFDYVAGTWVELDIRATTLSDSTVDVVLSNPSRFVSGSGAISARVSYRATSPVATYPWTARVDKLVWIISN